jgi:carbonic anhydrase
MKCYFRTLFVCLIILLPCAAQQSAATAPPNQGHHSSGTRTAPSADATWADLMAGNERFVEGKPQVRQLVELRNALAKGQHPKVIVLACSDSRVAPEFLFDQGLGDLFVVRSAGNIADAIGVGSIEYAVEHLGSTMLVVLGHTQCGAVSAACSAEKMPTPNLQAIVDKIGPAVTRAAASAKGDALIEAAVKQNVHQSAKDVLAASEVLRHFIEDGKLVVVEAEYQLETGKVTRLDSAQ